MKRHRIYSAALIGIGSVIGYSCFSQAQQSTVPGAVATGTVVKTETQTSNMDISKPGQAGASSFPAISATPALSPLAALPSNTTIYGSYFESGAAQKNKDWVVYRDGKFTIEHSESGMDAASMKERQEASKALDEIVKVLRSDTSSSEAISDAKAKLSQFLKVYFEADLTRRKKQIETMEEQIDKLKKQVAKRAASMDELIDLRIKILENDSQGLGFPQSWNMPNLSGIDSNNQNAWTFPAAGFTHSYGPSGQGYSVQYESAPASALAPATVLSVPATPTQPAPPRATKDRTTKPSPSQNPL
jgi:polyhydroxyalkanoate synthesis regulator phasin